jgi:hypothetical protein
MRAVRHGFGQRIITPAPVPARHPRPQPPARHGIGPAIARGDEAHFGQAEIEHRPRRLADILAQLRANKNDDRSIVPA